MKNLNVYTFSDIESLLGKRVGATTFGSEVSLLLSKENIQEQLQSHPAYYVLFGIVEDIGIRANYGRPGAVNAWQAMLRTLLNIQSNEYNRPQDVLLLGHLDFSELIESVDTNKGIQPSEMHAMVEEIDKQVAELVEAIVAAGKIPIAIGGGHNNAYGMLKGTSKGLNHAVNAINIDAHADLRPRDYRHSGNGFTYAYEEGYLKKYFIFGLHENYITEAISENIDNWADDIDFNTFEETHVRYETDMEAEAVRALQFVSATPSGFGLEIDMDVVLNMPSSAMSPSGFTLEEVRRLNYIFSRSKKIRYLHICEAAPNLSKSEEIIRVGKALTYLVTDFIRA